MSPSEQGHVHDRVFVRFAEFATKHPDGTFTLVRLGIDRWEAAALPLTVSLHAYVETLDPIDPGRQYDFHASMRAPSGAVLFEAKGYAEVDNREALRQCLVVPLETGETGEHVISVSVGALVGHANLTVTHGGLP